MAEPKAKDFKIEMYACLAAVLLILLVAILMYKLEHFWLFSERIRIGYLLLPRVWSALNALGSVVGYGFGIICAVHLSLLVWITGVLRWALARHFEGRVEPKMWWHSAIAPWVNVLLEIAGVFLVITISLIANPEQFSVSKVFLDLLDSFGSLTYVSSTMSQFSGLAMWIGDKSNYAFGLIWMLFLGLIVGVCVDVCRYVLEGVNKARA